MEHEPKALAIAPEVVRHLFGTAMAFAVPLRAGEGFDESAFNALCDALQTCADEWAATDVIPKTAANLLVDLSTGIEASSFQYQGDDNKKILHAADRIAFLVRECVAVPELNI